MPTGSSFQNNTQFRLDGTLTAVGTSVAITNAIEDDRVIDANDASVVLVSADRKTRERMIVDIENGVMTIVTRGISFDRSNTSVESLKKEWRTGTLGSITAFAADMIDANNSTGQAQSISGDFNFGGSSTFADVTITDLTVPNDGTFQGPRYDNPTARDTAIPTPTGFFVCMTAGVPQYYNPTTSQWEDFSTGTTTPNASTTVSGRTELATIAEQGIATANGSSGAPLVVANENTIKASSGVAANDENKAVVVSGTGKVDRSLVDISDNLIEAEAGEDLTAADGRGAVFVAAGTLDTFYEENKNESEPNPLSDTMWGDKVAFGLTTGNVVGTGIRFTTPAASERVSGVKTLTLTLGFDRSTVGNVNTPGDQLLFNLYEADKTTAVSGFVQQTYTPAQWRQYEVEIDMQNVSLTAGTEYFLSVTRSGTGNNTTHYAMSLATSDTVGYAHATFDGASWTDQTTTPVFSIQYQYAYEQGKMYHSDTRYKSTATADGKLEASVTDGQTARAVTYGYEDETLAASGLYYLNGSEGQYSTTVADNEFIFGRYITPSILEIKANEYKLHKEILDDRVFGTPVAGTDYYAIKSETRRGVSEQSGYVALKRATITRDGEYTVSVLAKPSADGAGITRVRFMRNGTQVYLQEPSLDAGETVTTDLDLVAGDEIEVQVDSTSHAYGYVEDFYIRYNLESLDAVNGTLDLG